MQKFNFSSGNIGNKTGKTHTALGKIRIKITRTRIQGDNDCNRKKSVLILGGLIALHQIGLVLQGVCLPGSGILTWVSGMVHHQPTYFINYFCKVIWNSVCCGCQ